MGIERYKPDDRDKVVFSFLTPIEGREALKMAIDLVAGECGEFTFIPVNRERDVLAERGYIAFAIGRGDKNALLSLTYPKVRNLLMEELNLLDDELDSMIAQNALTLPEKKR